MIDITSTTWKEISEWAERRRAKHLEVLSRELLDERQADTLRGRIAELDLLLIAGTPPKNIETEKVNYGV